MKNNHSNIEKAKKYLTNNDVVAIPTETVYGLAGNAYSNKAVKKIFSLKKRPLKNPLIVHYYRIKDLKQDCIVNETFNKLYRKFCPGPLTFVLNKKKNSKLSKYVNANKKTIAVRFPKNKITQDLLSKLNFPLAAPSANISTKLSSTKVNHLSKKLKNEKEKYNLAASFQKTINEILYEKTKIAMEEFLKNKKNKKNTFVIAGGVASNLTIRENLTKLSKEKNFISVFPPVNLCSDNAAMIAWVGIERFKINAIDNLEFPSKARWPLDSSAPFLKGPGLKI